MPSRLLAAREGHIHTAKVLLDAGAKMLLDRGADQNRRGHQRPHAALCRDQHRVVAAGGRGQAAEL